ncbi:MAG: ATP-binding protein [Chloroflexota bacterium]
MAALSVDDYNFHRVDTTSTKIQIEGVTEPELAILWFPYSSPDTLPELETLVAEAHALGKTNPLPVLLIIDQYGAHWVEPGFRLGVADILTRPIHPLVLRQRVKLLIQARHTEQALLKLKISEQAFRDERQRLFNVLDVLPAYVYLRNHDYSIRFANRTFVALFGVPRERKCFEILRGRNSPCDICLADISIRTGFPQEEEWTSLNSRIFMAQFNIFIDTDGDTLVLEIGIDITEYQSAKLAAMRAERMAAIGRLLASLAHEINNPLQAMLANLELILDFPVESDERIHGLQIVRAETERLQKIIGRILDYSRPRKITQQEIELTPVINSALQIAGKQLQARNITINLDIPEKLPFIYGSPDQIEQVCLNLIINASEHMAEGGQLIISAISTGDIINIAFKDSGKGIPDEIKDYIFEPFYTTKTNGTGLGLAVSKDIIQQHGGKISVESTPGIGSVFSFQIPINKKLNP